ncbi:hypothetical protein ACUM5Y_06315 [Marinomonas dokdonensis]|uniref:hypothetical protein n=1 Tax=Marinomonas dokdonensis TaxID=328224 RepID=UPI0040558353
MKVAILTFDGFNELDSFIAAGILNRMKEKGWKVQTTGSTPRVTSTKKQLIGAQCSVALILSALSFLKKLPASTDLTTKPRLQGHSFEVLEQVSYAKGNIATAGGCLASQYVAPVGEKPTRVNHCLAVVSPYL